MRRLVLLTLALGSFGCRKTEAPEPARETAPAAESPPPKPSAPPTPAPESQDVFDTSRGRLRVVPILHGMLRLELGQLSIYVDPHAADQIADTPKADLILITDIHGDHFDPAAIAKLSQPATRIVAPPVVAEKLEAAIAIENGETETVSEITIKAVPMYNLKRGPKPGALYHEKGRGNGYVLELGKRVYISGDTECTVEMRALTGIDIAFVSMNLPYTMPPEEALECIKAFRPKVVYPYHYRGSNLKVLTDAELPGTEVRVRNWYPKG